MMDTALTLKPSPCWTERVVLCASVWLFTWSISECLMPEVGKRRAMTLSVAPGCWSPGSLDHSTPRWLCRRQWRSVGLNWWRSTWTGERDADRDVYTDVMLHHLSGNTFCSTDSSSEFGATDLQVVTASKLSQTLITLCWWFPIDDPKVMHV